MPNTDGQGKTKTAHVSVVSVSDVFSAVTELQDDVTIIQKALNSIDTSSSSAFGQKLDLINTSLGNLLLNLNNAEARITTLETEIKNIATAPAPVTVDAPQPTFLQIIFGKFTNTWKNI